VRFKFNSEEIWMVATRETDRDDNDAITSLYTSAALAKCLFKHDNPSVEYAKYTTFVDSLDIRQMIDDAIYYDLPTYLPTHTIYLTTTPISNPHKRDRGPNPTTCTLNCISTHIT
jgi:hypothetical protein